ncbi:MAG: hypothetical protein JNL82_36105 [Myxococcales bacterium]|jgi:hypothetical protein|nr:hypothetical protein [Myxococcales bacterium]
MTRRPAFPFLLLFPRRTHLIHPILLGISLLSACNGPKTGESDTEGMAKCSTHTKCSAGYKCNFGNANPSNPHAVGECEYQTCGLTEPCKKPQQCLPDKETASCDKFDNDKFCGCVGTNSQEVPSDPTTGPPTTGARP